MSKNIIFESQQNQYCANIPVFQYLPDFVLFPKDCVKYFDFFHLTQNLKHTAALRSILNLKSGIIKYF